MGNNLLRFAWSGIGIILFLSLCIYVFLNYEFYYPTITGFSQDPLSYEGRIIEVEGKIIEEDGKHYLISVSNIPIEVEYDWAEWVAPKAGTVAILGVMHKEGYIEILEMHVENYHLAKYFMSFFGFFILFFFFFKEWKISLKGFGERGVKDA